MRNISDGAAEKIKTHILCSINFTRKSYRVKDGVENYGTAGHAKNDNKAYAHYILNNLGYRHTLRIFNTYCFYVGKIVMRTRRSVRYIRTSPALFLFTLKVRVESRYIVCCWAFLPLSLIDVNLGLKKSRVNYVIVGTIMTFRYRHTSVEPTSKTWKATMYKLVPTANGAAWCGY